VEIDPVGVHAPKRIDSGVPRRGYGMDAPKSRARRIDEASASTLVAAFEAFSATGECPIMCDRCCTPIKFERQGEAAWKHHCSCGKYSGTLRGL
jgi:hypothetical protein